MTPQLLATVVYPYGEEAHEHIEEIANNFHLWILAFSWASLCL